MCFFFFRAALLHRTLEQETRNKKCGIRETGCIFQCTIDFVCADCAQVYYLHGHNIFINFERSEKTKVRIKILTLLFVTLLAASNAQSEIIFVDADAPGPTHDGSSWTDAYNNLQDALATAQYGDEIRVAQGIYKPDQGVGVMPGDREATFQLKNGVTLKGGYAGFGEPNPDDRDITAYETILSGDLAGNDVDVNYPAELLDEPTHAENSYNVVTTNITNETALLDGFTITSGNANSDSFPHYYGSGMYNYGSSPTLMNCTFSKNSAKWRGGGVFNDNISNPTLTDCTFIGNFAKYGGGGGMCNRDSNPILINCKFSGNSSGTYGGGLRNSGDSSPMLTNCTFDDNSAYRNGGGMINEYISYPTLTNCTFSSNSAGWNGGGMHNHFSSRPIVTNCTFTGNSADDGGGMFGGGILNNCTFSRNHALWDGGGIRNASGSEPITINCIFINNSSQHNGGGMYNSGNMLMTNCIFSGNRAFSDGGGMYNYHGNPILTNCTFHGNLAQFDGNALACASSTPRNIEATNCIFWDGGKEIWNDEGSTITITYSDVQGSWPGQGNIDTDPCFVDPGYWDPNGTTEDANDDFWVEGDYHLKSQTGRWNPNSQTWVQDDVASPCIDAGNPISPIGNEPFPNGGIVNMGVYGGTAEASKSYLGQPVCETIFAGDINGDCKVNFLDFRLMCLHWLEDNTPSQNASRPIPANGAENVSPLANLIWIAGAGATSHDVYFGISNPPPFISNQEETTFDPGTMDYETRYYWRIDEISQWGKAIGEVWGFTTVERSIPLTTDAVESAVVVKQRQE